MKVKTNTLTGLALRWAVAKAEGLDVYIPAYADTPWLQIRCDDNVFICPNWDENWAHGGPIIELNIVELLRCSSSSRGRTEVFWEAAYGLEDDADHVRMTGPTPLIAACRCRVASKLGDEVDVPEELL